MIFDISQNLLKAFVSLKENGLYPIRFKKLGKRLRVKEQSVPMEYMSTEETEEERIQALNPAECYKTCSNKEIDKLFGKLKPC